MKISVIVPVYNCEPYVERCIRSIMAQTYTDLEIICINDGSTDSSGEILEQLAYEDSRIRVVHQANSGASAARNAGIDIATGDFITFVDSDDSIESNMYETLIPYFSDENIDIVHCGYKRIRLDGSIKDVNGTGKVIRQNKYEAAECLVSGKLFVGSLWNKLFRADLFHAIHMDTQLVINEDVLVLAELFTRAKEIIYFDIGKYHFFERESSVTSATTQYKKLIDCLTVAERMLDMYIGTSVEQSAEERVLNTQIGLYRWFVMHDLKNSKAIRRNLAEKIDTTMADTPVSSMQKLNYRMLKYIPRFYKRAYRVYDRIRVPDWDVK